MHGAGDDARRILLLYCAGFLPTQIWLVIVVCDSSLLGCIALSSVEQGPNLGQFGFRHLAWLEDPPGDDLAILFA